MLSLALLALHTPSACALPTGHVVRGSTPPRRTVIGAAAAAASLSLMRSPLAANAKDRITGYSQQRDWESTLTSGQYYILRQGGTEPPNSSPLAKEKRAGTFVCAGCGTPLFASDQKFESGTGWPSYAKGLEGVETVSSVAALLLGSELRCGGCGGHLGDVFNDGMLFPGTPAALTGKRYCIDGAALLFIPADGSAPTSGDGLTKPRYARPEDVEMPNWLKPPKVA